MIAAVTIALVLATGTLIRRDRREWIMLAGVLMLLGAGRTLAPSTQTDLRDASVLVPFPTRHELKQKIQHCRPPYIQKMAAADVQRGAIHHRRPTQSARFRLLLEQNEGRTAGLQKLLGKRQAGWANPQDAKIDVQHAHRNIHKPSTLAARDDHIVSFNADGLSAKSRQIH